jgi:hypothetical protein
MICVNIDHPLPRYELGSSETQAERKTLVAGFEEDDPVFSFFAITYDAVYKLPEDII